MSLQLQVSELGITFHVKVVPNSSRALVAGLLGDALKIKVPQPPEDGKANRAVEALIAKTLGVAPSQVAVVGGLSQPRKTVRVSGVAAESLLAALCPSK